MSTLSCRVPGALAARCAVACLAAGLISTAAEEVAVKTNVSSSPPVVEPAISRQLPTTRPDHPGNVFLDGEPVAVPVPTPVAAKAQGWQLTDVAGTVQAKGEVPPAGADAKPVIALGKLGIGWYRLDFLDAAGSSVGWTTAAVLAPPRVPVPNDSPVCADSATAWFARQDAPRQDRFACLAALAGVNWIRDRMSWGEVETAPGTMAPATTSYDSSASLQAAAGLKVLQVFHGTPGWAVDRALDGDDGGRRFPRDLRRLYAYCKAMAERYRGRVLAWEPWNEANIDGFGGHTIDEMCSLQKAAYLGFKAGDPGLVVCWNVYAGSGSRLHTAGVLENEAWPYFDTYNIHSYSSPESYLNEFAPAREAACGKPLWITECGIHVPWKTERPWGDVAPEDERRQAEFIARSYASSLCAGVTRHFFFILGNYIENTTQFGLLRHDQTPRPGYVALAAVGRFLAGARCLGRWQAADSPNLRAYAFASRPDGTPRDVLVAWDATGAKLALRLPPDVAAEAAFDHLGRRLPAPLPEATGSGAVFLVLPTGTAAKLPLEPPRGVSDPRPGLPSPVVLQLQSPREATRLDRQAHAVDPKVDNDLTLFAYNFSDHEVQGTVRVEALPADWRLTPREWQVSVPAADRTSLPARCRVPGRGRDAIMGGSIRLRGDFGDDGQPALAFRLQIRTDKLEVTASRAIESGAKAESWEDNIVSEATMRHDQASPGSVGFDMHFAGTDPWGYPRLKLADTEVPDDTWDGLALTVQLLEGTGVVRVQFIEENGASYITDVGVNPGLRTPQPATVLFQNTAWGSWSRPDPDGALQPEKIRTILVGINSQRNSTVRMVLSDLAWVRF